MKVTIKYINSKLRTLLKLQPVTILEMSLQMICLAGQWHSRRGTCSCHYSPSGGQVKLLRKNPLCCHFWLYFRVCTSPLSKLKME